MTELRDRIAVFVKHADKANELFRRLQQSPAYQELLGRRPGLIIRWSCIFNTLYKRTEIVDCE